MSKVQCCDWLPDMSLSNTFSEFGAVSPKMLKMVLNNNFNNNDIMIMTIMMTMMTKQ